MKRKHKVALFTPCALKSVTFIQQPQGCKLKYMIHYCQDSGLTREVRERDVSCGEIK